MIDCERCGQAVSWTSDTVTLCGGFKAHFCVDCRNDWSEHIKETPEYAALLKAEAKEKHFEDMSRAHTPVGLAERENFIQYVASLEQKIFPMGKAFVKTKIDRKVTA